jgi:hypothetical protein
VVPVNGGGGLRLLPHKFTPTWRTQSVAPEGRRLNVDRLLWFVAGITCCHCFRKPITNTALVGVSRSIYPGMTASKILCLPSRSIRVQQLGLCSYWNNFVGDLCLAVESSSWKSWLGVVVSCPGDWGALVRVCCGITSTYLFGSSHFVC